MPRLFSRRHLLALAALASTLGAAHAQTWPSQPLRMLVGSSPGGGTDAMARAVADKLGPALKTTVVVENRPGASNTLAVDVVVKSTDGHTMVMGVSTAHAIAPHLIKLAYDNDHDLVPVAYVGAVPNVLVVSATSPYKTVADLVAAARKQPGVINYASSGNGSTQHIAGELFEDATGVATVHIPYRGSGPALVDLMAGQVQMSFDTLASVMPHIKNGKLRALAVCATARNPELPTVPTLAESGVKGVEMSAWYGIYMPSATPKAVQQRVAEEVSKLLTLPDTKARLANIGADLTPMSPPQFQAFHVAENKRYAELIKKRGIKAD
ncbi:tripartite-type tricarboxylate transporter receptor subunit TctC [Sphaerotilus hippei]|uniref:Tripartite-type tricarboxylate transporter receptor subunit TctC n=1 Tax=Sphaerotilus hippei TaxID=744406 RepID=A0A318H3W8_9BURK|nr:tripartite tricarboxylate transporter substrate binding protein [Sphaerotilus hippei]PXW97604.1 tripartite-type tricarboxylate transporter receptor subunit TctC [Sphaerotilus hippei]